MTCSSVIFFAEFAIRGQAPDRCRHILQPPPEHPPGGDDWAGAAKVDNFRFTSDEPHAVQTGGGSSELFCSFSKIWPQD